MEAHNYTMETGKSFDQSSRGGSVGPTGGLGLLLVPGKGVRAAPLVGIFSPPGSTGRPFGCGAGHRDRRWRGFRGGARASRASAPRGRSDRVLATEPGNSGPTPRSLRGLGRPSGRRRSLSFPGRVLRPSRKQAPDRYDCGTMSRACCALAARTFHSRWVQDPIANCTSL